MESWRMFLEGQYCGIKFLKYTTQWGFYKYCVLREAENTDLGEIEDVFELLHSHSILWSNVDYCFTLNYFMTGCRTLHWKLKLKSKTVILLWIPGHCGIEGNGNAEWEFDSPRGVAVAEFSLTTGHDCLAAIYIVSASKQVYAVPCVAKTK